MADITLPKGLRGHEILNDHLYNKGSAFTDAERIALRIDGLLPPVVNTIEEQEARVMENYHKKPTDIEKYIFLMALLDYNLILFNRVLVNHLEEMMPIIYTPTVGKACLEYSHILRRPQGVFLAAHEKGRYAELLRQWPEGDVRVIVVTDGERILGLGDLGTSGMGIPVGKLCLYAAGAGIHFRHCLPVMIDVGTNNADFINDPLYMGLRQERIRGKAYDEIIEEFFTAVQEVFPNALVQFEDFGNQNAFRLLENYRNRVCCFNDDIQGTACVSLAGLSAAMRFTGRKLQDQTFLFLGAGEAGTGIGELIVSALVKSGLSPADAYRRCWFVDSKGLVVKSREGLATHKKPFAHDHAPAPDFLSAIKALKPTAIIGVSGQTGKFDKQVLKTMAEINEQPIIFALSNPTVKAECTASEAYTWTQGHCLFASGSPFDPVTIDEKTFTPGQGNNAYVFPGIGLGIIASEARLVTEEMFLVAAETLANRVSQADFESGLLYPPLNTIRRISLHIAIAVAELAFEEGLARVERPENIADFIQSQMFEPHFSSYV
ncbi:MAG: NAD-dependent malic enzyme [Phycisphaerales bacterium]|jgi:malate dehydrogenase (oxaloacetate-decarboxylating)(NADP+)